MNRFFALAVTLLALASCGSRDIIDLPRRKASEKLDKAFSEYLRAVETDSVNMHSVMIVQHGKVLEEKWFGDETPGKPHILHSVSKTFTATAVGLAANEGLLKLSDRLVDFFPDKLPDMDALPPEQRKNLEAVTVRDLLTMNCGHDTDPSGVIRRSTGDWVEAFLAVPVVHTPGTFYCYSSIGTYMLSAIVQKLTGEKVVDYLTPRLFGPLHIEKPHWDESPQGINTGGWGLYLKTEDLAKMGQLFLQKGKWNGKQVLPEEWVAEASSFQVPSVPSGVRPEDAAKLGETSDWVQGYGYQMWRCRHNAYRADGAYGQYIIVIPEKDAVIAATARTGDMQKELNLFWDNILPAL
ncbi:MAG: serine hydrolase [Bacteroidales bacterium]|nr:serine hydrolase [Bacteroidales bacterium]